MSGEKYPFFEPTEDDVAPLFTSKMQEAAHVGCLRGVFDNGGVSTDWIAGNDALRSPVFDAELQDLFETLRNKGPLENLQSVRQFCHSHPQARMSGRQTFYAFRIDTSRYRYYLRLFPQKRKYYIFCYQTDQFKKDFPTPNFNYLYRKRPKSKQKSGGER